MRHHQVPPQLRADGRAVGRAFGLAGPNRRTNAAPDATALAVAIRERRPDRDERADAGPFTPPNPLADTQHGTLARADHQLRADNVSVARADTTANRPPDYSPVLQPDAAADGAADGAADPSPVLQPDAAANDAANGAADPSSFLQPDAAADDAADAAADSASVGGAHAGAHSHADAGPDLDPRLLQRPRGIRKRERRRDLPALRRPWQLDHPGVSSGAEGPFAQSGPEGPWPTGAKWGVLGVDPGCGFPSADTAPPSSWSPAPPPIAVFVSRHCSCRASHHRPNAHVLVTVFVTRAACQMNSGVHQVTSPLEVRAGMTITMQPMDVVDENEVIVLNGSGAAGAFSLFTVRAGGAVVLSSLHITSFGDSAISAFNGSAIALSRVVLGRNSADGGASGTARRRRALLSSSSSHGAADGCGGAIRLVGASAVLSGCSFERNEATRGGALCAINGSTVVIDEGSVLDANHAAHGGAIFASGSGTAIRVSNTMVSHNRGTANRTDTGGAISVAAGANATLDGGVLLSSNVAEGNGGAISGTRLRSSPYPELSLWH